MHTPDQPNLVYGTYNVANALAHPDRIDTVLDELRHNDVAIIGLNEALPAQYGDTATIRERFDRAGYELHLAENDDADERFDARQTGLAIRNDIRSQTHPSVVRLATRNAWRVDQADDLLGGRLTYYTGHFDDRSNAARQVQFDAFFSKHLHGEGETAIGADFNVSYPNESGAVLSHVLATMTKYFRETQPTRLTGNKLTPGRLRSIARRLDENTHSDQLSQFEANGLQDVDADHSPTHHCFGILRTALDRIMVSSGVMVVEQGVRPRSVSDHSLVVARLTLKVCSTD